MSVDRRGSLDAELELPVRPSHNRNVSIDEHARVSSVTALDLSRIDMNGSVGSVEELRRVSERDGLPEEDGMSEVEKGVTPGCWAKCPVVFNPLMTFLAVCAVGITISYLLANQSIGEHRRSVQLLAAEAGVSLQRHLDNVFSTAMWLGLLAKSCGEAGKFDDDIIEILQSKSPKMSLFGDVWFAPLGKVSHYITRFGMEMDDGTDLLHDQRTRLLALRALEKREVVLWRPTSDAAGNVVVTALYPVYLPADRAPPSCSCAEGNLPTAPTPGMEPKTADTPDIMGFYQLGDQRGFLTTTGEKDWTFKWSTDYPADGTWKYFYAHQDTLRCVKKGRSSRPGMDQDCNWRVLRNNVTGDVTAIQDDTGNQWEAVAVDQELLESRLLSDRERFWGFTGVELNIDGLTRLSKLDTMLAHYSVQLRDSSGEVLFPGALGISGEQPEILTLRVPGGEWQMLAIPRVGWESEINTLWFGAALTFMCAVFLAWVAYHSTLKTNRLHREIQTRFLIERELLLSKIDLEEASQVKSNFISNISHELRTPLNGIMGLQHMLQDTELDEEQLNLVLETLSCSRSLLAIINDILDFSSMECGVISVNSVQFSTSALMDSLCHAIGLDAAKKASEGVHTVIDVDLKMPLLLLGDMARIQQCILNILQNGLKFTEKGSVEVYIFYGNDNLNVSVMDTGVGIEQERLAEFNKQSEPFNQVDGTNSRRYNGLGLGLHISKHLTELMGGSLVLSSSVGTEDGGNGTTVRMAFPCPLAIQDDENTSVWGLPQLAGLHEIDPDLVVLVVPLERTRLLMEEWLGKSPGFGFRVVAFGSLKEVTDAVNEGSLDITKSKFLVIDADVSSEFNDKTADTNTWKKWSCAEKGIRSKLVLVASFGIDVSRFPLRMASCVRRPVCPSSLHGAIQEAVKINEDHFSPRVSTFEFRERRLRNNRSVGSGLDLLMLQNQRVMAQVQKTPLIGYKGVISTMAARSRKYTDLTKTKSPPSFTRSSVSPLDLRRNLATTPREARRRRKGSPDNGSRSAGGMLSPISLGMLPPARSYSVSGVSVGRRGSGSGIPVAPSSSKSPPTPLLSWLQSISPLLTKYHANFLHEGFDSTSAIKLIDQDDLAVMGNMFVAFVFIDSTVTSALIMQ